MPFETPGTLDKEEVKTLQKESLSKEKSTTMEKTFATQEGYKNFIAERDQYLERSKNETSKKYIDGLFNKVISKYADLISKFGVADKKEKRIGYDAVDEKGRHTTGEVVLSQEEINR